jgi:hypothetical protein
VWVKQAELHPELHEYVVPINVDLGEQGVQLDDRIARLRFRWAVRDDGTPLRR